MKSFSSILQSKWSFPDLLVKVSTRLFDRVLKFLVISEGCWQHFLRSISSDLMPETLPLDLLERSSKFSLRRALYTSFCSWLISTSTICSFFGGRWPRTSFFIRLSRCGLSMLCSSSICSLVSIFS